MRHVFISPIIGGLVAIIVVGLWTHNGGTRSAAASSSSRMEKLNYLLQIRCITRYRQSRAGAPKPFEAEHHIRSGVDVSMVPARSEFLYF